MSGSGPTGSICFLAPYAYPFFDESVSFALGGAERQQVLLAQALKERGYIVRFIVARFTHDQLREVEGIELIPSFRLESRWPAPIRLMAKYWGLVRRLRSRRQDVLYQRGNLVFAILLWLCGKLFGLRYVYAVASDTDLDPREHARWVFSGFVRAVRGAHLVIAQTEDQLAVLRRRFQRESVLIRSLVATPLAAEQVPPLEARRVVLWVGRLEETYKKPLALLELARAAPDVQFLMVGRPIGSDDVHRQVLDAARSLGNLEYREHVPPDRIQELFQEAIALVSTSIYEGFPNTYLEAWRTGTPVVGLVDPDGLIHRHGVGIVCDSTQDLAGALRRLRDDSEAYAAISARCLELIREEFSLEISIEKFEAALSG